MLPLLLLSGGSFVFGQNKVQIDSLFSSSTVNIYENPDSSIRLGDSILQTTSNTDIQIKALMLISDGYSSKRNYQKSVEHLIKANQLAAKTKDGLLRIKLLNKTAIQYQQLKIYEKTIEYLDLAEKLILSHPERDSVTVYLANTYVVRGIIYKSRLNCDIGITFLEKGIKEYEKVDTPVSYANSSIAYYNKGNCYLLLKDNEQAKLSFQESIRLAKKINANSLLAFAQKGLAEVLTIQGRYSEAISVLDEALVLASGVGDLILNQGIYRGLSDNHLAINDWENYQRFNQLYLQNRLKIKESERVSISDSLKEIEKEQNAKLDELLPNYQYGIYLLIFISILIIAVAIIGRIKLKREIRSLKNVVEGLQKEQT